MKGVGDEGERMDGIAWRILERRHGISEASNLPTISSKKKKAESISNRIIIRVDLESAMTAGR